MKKLLGIVVLGLLWCSASFAECIEGDCINGYGTFTWASGNKYVGEHKDGKGHGQGTLIFISFYLLNPNAIVPFKKFGQFTNIFTFTCR